MRGHPIVKVARLARHLAARPERVGRYLRTATRTPLALGLPWFSWPAIEFLNDHIRPGMDVFEYGGGGSTVFFASRGAKVVTVEDQPSWARRIRSALEAAGVDAVIRNAEADLSRPEGFGASTYLHALDRPYDIVAIDGPEMETPAQLRPLCFDHAQSHVRSGGLIVLDDAWRYDGRLPQSCAREHRVFEGVGPGRLGVTRTDVYVY